ncbi:MAG: ATP-binding protein [Bacteroidetes bacterium]|nr:ATP-binding protein [Bacteroidota bacterium]
MFYRKIIDEFDQWLHNPERKPLVLRGARQVGKTTIVHEWSRRFKQYIHLNLELPEDRALFQEFKNMSVLMQQIFFSRNKSLALKEDTLIFIDEIQELPVAMGLLRYFYELEPTVKVIAAGSMLESVFNNDIHFPVGRVEYKVLRPASFPEFLGALGEAQALEQLENMPCPNFAHERLLQLYREYAITGGMPEVVNKYARNRDLKTLRPVYDSLIASYLEDVEKYAQNDVRVLHLRHAIRASLQLAGQRIQFAGFGQSAYRSREMGEALRALEKVWLVQLIYPTSSATLPLIPDLRKSPRLQILDTGLLNYFVGLQKEMLLTQELSSVYRGIMMEHLSGQELLAHRYEAMSSLAFWSRDKNSSSAEVDFVESFDGMVIPIENKSGKTGTLRSLHQFMEIAPHRFAVRLYAGRLEITEARTPRGRSFRLLNLPYYLGTQLRNYLDWFVAQ